MYSGATTELAPTPSPPMNRATLSDHTPCAAAEPTADSKNSAAIPSNDARRPYRSAGMPPTKAPMTVPYSAEPTICPFARSLRFHCACKRSFTPLMTAVSKPKRKPPRATVTAQPYTFFMVGR